MCEEHPSLRKWIFCGWGKAESGSRSIHMHGNSAIYLRRVLRAETFAVDANFLATLHEKEVDLGLLQIMSFHWKRVPILTCLPVKQVLSCRSFLSAKVHLKPWHWGQILWNSMCRGASKATPCSVTARVPSHRLPCQRGLPHASSCMAGCKRRMEKVSFLCF